MQGSVESDPSPGELEAPGFDGKIYVARGDHAEELSNVCSALHEASKYSSNDRQKRILSDLIKSLQTGSLAAAAYREALKNWIQDVSLKVETILGFVEPIRDPQGVRAEWEGVIAISDPVESAKLKELVQSSTQ